MTPLFLASIQAVDIAAFIEFLDEARVDEVLRLGRLCFGIRQRQLVNDDLQPLHGGILFGGQLIFVDGALVGLLQ